ncbi:MAG: PAS domain S-box protein [Chloroflexota bacterium]
MVSADPLIGKILIVENDPERLKALEGILHERGHAVDTHLDAKTAYKTIKKGLPDLVLLSSSMPGKDTYKIGNQLKANKLTSHIPVIFIQAQDEENTEKGFAAGGADYIRFPLQPKEAYTRIETQLALRIANQKIKADQSETSEYSSQLEDLVKHNPSVFFIWGATHDWPVKFVSENILTQFGYSPEEFYAKQISYREIIHPDDLERVAREVAQHSKKKDINFEQEYRIITKSGEICWVTDRTRVHLDPKGNPQYYQGVLLDITKRKLTEKALKESQERHVLAQEIGNIGHWEWDAITDELILSDEAFQILGLPPKERLFNRASILQFLDQEETEYISRLIKTPVAEKSVYEVEHLVRREDGEIRQVLNLFEADFDGEGQLSGIFGTMQDITERKQAEEEREAALALLQTTINGVSDPIMYVGLDYKVKLSNQATKDNFIKKGKNQDQFCYQISHNRETPCDGVEHPCPLTRLMETKSPTQVTHEHIRADGSKRVMEINVSPVFDEDHQITGFVESMRDITQQEHAVSIIKQSEEKYRNLVENMPLGVMLVDAEGNILQANPALVEMLGSPSIQLTRQINVLTSPLLSKHEFSAGIKTCLATGEIITRESKYSSKWEKKIVLRFHLSPVRDDQEEIIGVQAVLEDITERSQNEETVRKLTRAVEQSASTIVITDLEGSIEFVNPAFSAITGFSPEEAIGENPRILKSGEIPDEVYTELWETISQGEVWKGELLNRTQNNELYWEFATIAPVKDKDQNVTHYIAVKDDITARKKTENALQESEEKFRSLVNQSADGIILINENGEITEWNQGQELISGLKREDVINTSFWETQTLLIREENRTPAMKKKIKAGFEEFLTSFTAASMPFKNERVIQRSDGELRTVQTVTFPINIDGDIKIGIIGRDITDKIQIEDELRKRTQQLEILREKGLKITEQLNLNPVLRSVVERSIELLGSKGGGIYLYEPLQDSLTWAVGINSLIPINSVLAHGEGMAGKVLESRDFLIVDDYSTWNGRSQIYSKETFTSVLQVPIMIGEEFLGVLSVQEKKEGSKFTLEDAEQLKMFADQAAMAIRNSHLFEGEKKARQEAETLQAVSQALSTELELNEVLELIISEMRKVVPYDSLSVQFLDENLLTIIAVKGFSNPEDIIGLTFDQNEEDNPNHRVITSQKPLILNNPAKNYGNFNVPPFNQSKTKSWLGVPLLYGNSTIGMIAFDHQDPGFYNPEHAKLALSFATQAAIAIKNAHIFKELLEAHTEADLSRRKAETANQAKSVFLANMSHELRTPLNAILGFAQILSRDTELSLIQQSNLDIISQSGSHLLEMINAVLEISKIEAGLAELKEGSFNVLGLLDTIEAMFALQASKKNLALSIDPFPNLPEFVKADEGKLRQVLINLVANAIKFTHQGSVSIRVKEEIPNKTERRTRSKRKLRFEVEDTGTGINPEDLELIFKPFGQSGSGKSTEEGTGLGLTISKEYVELMGGTIEVSSSIGKGTKFTFEIPFAPGVKEESLSLSLVPKIIGLAPEQPLFRILVADDNALSRSLFVQALKIPGLLVYTVNNGEEAIQILDTWKADLIFMDIQMPVLDGYEATRQIKEKEVGKDTPIIAITAGAFEDEKEKLFSIGFADYMLKPISLEKIFEALERHTSLDFVYSERKINLASKNRDETKLAERITGLPIELQKELYHAAIAADRQGTKSVIDRIQSKDETLANALDIWLNDFRFDKIIHVLGE